MTNKHTVVKQDIELFRQSMRDMTPIVQNTAELPRGRTRRPRAARLDIDAERTQSLATEAAITEMEQVTVSAGDELLFKRSGVQDKVFRKLRRGHFSISAELDLHGMTAHRARIALDQFMDQMLHTRGQCCIHIIHGKGQGSRNGHPVIKLHIQSWLQCNKEVLAYCSCRPSDGGTGAIYVLLKSRA